MGYEIFSNCAKLPFALVTRIKNDKSLSSLLEDPRKSTFVEGQLSFMNEVKAIDIIANFREPSRVS